MGYVIMIRKRSWDKDEAIDERPTEKLAISQAERLYSRYGMDMVAVVTINPETGKYEIPYKVTRNCKHRNVQLDITNKWICVDCGEEIIPIELDSVKLEVACETR